MNLADIFRFLFICLEVLLLFNLLIFVHELGHFLAARWRGLYVEEFALWFGKPLWRKKFRGVWYAINSIPAGGYVKLPQMAPMEAIEGGCEELPPEARRPIKPLDKIIVAFAGPLFSFLLAFAMAAIVWQVGRPDSEIDRPVIGYVEKGGPADRSGLKVGDEILEVDGKRVTHFVSGTNSVKWAIIRSEGEKIPFRVRRDGKEEVIYSSWAKPKASTWNRPALREVQIGPMFVPGVGFVARKSLGAEAGLRTGDLVVEAAGRPTPSAKELFDIMLENRGRALPMVVEREGARVPLSLNVPQAKDNEAIDLGIQWGRTMVVHPGPWEQVSDAATSIFRMVGALFSSKSDVKVAHFSGPVGIMRLYYQVFESPDGWRRALALSVLINVNLALINLLPFPVLDGGHITLALIEGVRRKPVNQRVLEILQTACAVLLLGFMLYVTVFDVGDIVRDNRADAEAAEKAKAETPPSK
jgi:regulator of sigma E protease